MWSLRWGAPPVPLLPRVLRTLWAHETLPVWLTGELGLPDDCTASALGASVWINMPRPRATHRVDHYVLFFLKSRATEIASLKCFDRPWPRGLRMESIPFGTRSTNLIRSKGGFENPDWLMGATFGALLSISNLGVKSLVEICTLVEAAVDLHERVTTDLSGSSMATEQGHANSAPEGDTRWAEALTTLLQEPWADQVSELDPRFRDILPAGRGTLEERAEAALSDPSTSATYVPSLVGSLPKVRELVASVESQFLEDGLIELLSAAMGRSTTHLNAVAARFGWRGYAPLTLQESGDLEHISRQRVSQLEKKVRHRLTKYTPFLPKLDIGINLLEASTPIFEEDASHLLKQRGLSRISFSPTSLIRAAEILGRKTTLSVTAIGDRRVVVSESNEHSLGPILRTARRLAGEIGVVSIFQLLDRLALSESLPNWGALGSLVTDEDVRRLMRGHPNCEFIDEDWFWYTDLPDGRNRLVNIAKKILSIASPQLVSSVREGVRRAFRHRSTRVGSNRFLVVPPQSVMANFLTRHPDFRIDGDLVGSVQTLDFRDLLGQGEQAIVDTFRTSSAGVLDRKSLVADCLARGINENTLAVYTTYSPVLEHLGLDLWKLRGVRVDPAAVEAVRSQNQIRPREVRLIDQGWTPDGKLWVAWKLPNTLAAIVLGVPGAVRRYLRGRSFRIMVKESGKESGRVSVSDNGSSYGYGPCLRYLSADEGDTMLAEFDLAKEFVQISIADSTLLEEG